MIMGGLTLNLLLFIYSLYFNCVDVYTQDIVACGGFIKSDVEINFSLIEVKLFTIQGNLKYQSLCAPNNGYYTLPVYDKGHYVLKVSAPKGWTFEPESVEVVIDGRDNKCSLNEDINFTFTGFGLIGRVVSQGQSSGPVGVTLTLKQASSKSVLRTTKSGTNGDYVFDKVLPGDYIVEGSHPLWKLQPNSVTVKVAKETGSAPNVITVLGFDVRGRVVSDGEPVTGVYFALFSDQVQASTISDCEKNPIKGRPKWDGKEPLCYVTSGSDGAFVFPSLPCGKYKLIPYYRGDNTVFDVVPSQLEFTVNQESIVIKDVFTVAGFSVGGKVLIAAGGAGVGGAKISLDGREEATTRDDGTYHLDGMKAGTYKLEVKAAKLHFEPQDVKITPNTSQLPDVTASSFEVCGEVKLTRVPEGMSRSKKVRITNSAHASEATDVNTDNSGAFCVYLKPGKYSVKVVLSPEEVLAGLLVTPSEREVTVSTKPQSGIVFTQFLASLSGVVKCLETPCKKIPVTLTASGDRRDTQNVQASGESNSAQFSFSNLLPGKYQVSLIHDDWCWKQKTIDVEIAGKDVSDVIFEQNGYVLSVSASHDLTLNSKLEPSKAPSGDGKEGKPAAAAPTTTSHEVKKGVNKVCLSRAGVYHLTPVSCHQFDNDKIIYDTSKPTVVNLVATRHRLDGSVVTSTPQADIVITIKSSESATPTTVGPLKAEQGSATASDKTLYKFSHWVTTGETLRVSATSGRLLFSPPHVDVTIDGESCQGENVKLEGRQGQFLTGSVTPPHADIKLRAQLENGDEASSIELVTDSAGKYSVGPLDPDLKYVVVPSQDGYVFSEVEGKKGHFRAIKLGQVTVKVADGSQPLGSVLVSLSGEAGYRKNQLTDDSGSIAFGNLKPGQYFLRPMMKEFDFEPSSRIVDVVEGSQITVSVAAKRIAFSCFGVINSLNGEAEPGVLVEAVGRGSGECDLLQEECKTEQDGTFRIRGLLPRCEYAIRLKSCTENSHIEQTSPSSKIVRVTDKDVTDLRLIAFRATTTMDVSINVDTPAEHLSTLKASLYRQNNLDTAIHTQALGPSFFFFLPTLQIDNQTYVVRLTSSLSRSQYHYSLPEVTFKANSSFRHFTLSFKASRKTLEQELAHSSLLILPFTLLLVIAAVYHEKVLPVVQSQVSQLFGAMNDRLAVRRTPSGRSAPVSPAQALADIDLDQFDTNKAKKKVRKA